MSADPFLDDESGAESSLPREFYDISQNGSTIYRIASGSRDVTYLGNTYTAFPSARTDIAIEQTAAEMQLVLTLPLSHALAQRFTAQGSPPRQVQVTAWRKQVNSGLVERIWFGYITSMAIERHIAKFAIPSRFRRNLDRAVPTVVIDRSCPHILYDGVCRIDPAGFTQATTVVSFDGRRITVVSVGAFGDNNYAVGGDFRHNATGEYQTILEETAIDVSGNVTFTLQLPIPELKDGDAVTIRAGCAHDIDTCHNKFANEVNYGGLPYMPSGNLFLPSGYGVFTG